MSIGGIKEGTLQYFGKTHIAPGFWCGIELDDPEGKHDGSVEGVRYFECSFGHGIFAPAERVSKIEQIEDVIQQQVQPIQQLPQPKFKQKRQLPLPKFQSNRQESTESLLRSKIIEEQEAASQYYTESNKYSKPSKSYFQEGLYDRKSLNIDDLLQQQYGDSCEKRLSSTFTISDGKGSDFEEIAQIPQKRASRRGQRQNLSAVSTDGVLEVDGNALNNTYTLPNEKIEQLNYSHTESVSCGEECIDPELKECLNSDGRQYFNLTFDTERNNSPNLSNSRSSDKFTEQGFQDELDATPVPKCDVMSESMTSSLGVLDLEDVLYRSELSDDFILDSSNLTDLEKIVQSCEKSKRVASLNDTFEHKNVISSTPLVSEKSHIALDRTQTLSKSRMQTDIPEEVGDFSDEQVLEDLRQNLNSTFQASSGKGVDLPIVGEDTLDWRHEASDSEEQQSDDSLENSFSSVNKNLYRGYNVKSNLNTTYGVESNNSRVDSLTEKLDNLGLNKDESIQSLKEIGLTREQVQKLDKPMTDSGISVKGLTDSTNSLQSSTEGIIFRQRKPMTDSGISLQSDGMADSQEIRWSQNLDSLQELTETAGFDGKGMLDPSQLAKDLQAGHDKRGRPLSLISTTSADTGKIFIPEVSSAFLETAPPPLSCT